MNWLSEIFIHAAHASEEAATASPNVVALFGLSTKLFLAQLLNFAIVLLVLWKWVFTPVTRGLQARTKKIEQSLKNAEDIEVQKGEFEKWKSASMQEARVEASGIRKKARAEAELVQAEVLAKSKLEQERIVLEGKTKLEQEQTRLLAEARAKLADVVILATEKILNEQLTDKKSQELAEKALSSIK